VPYEIRWDQKAREFLRTLDPQIAQQIIKKANNIVDFPEHYLEYLVEIRFYEEPLSLMRETLHNVQGMKAHSEIQFSLDSENLKDCCP